MCPAREKPRGPLCAYGNPIYVHNDKNSIKIYGQPNLEITEPIEIKNYLKDHRIFMMSTIAALTCGGNWKIHDKDSINTSFPSFLKIVKIINGKSL